LRFLGGCIAAAGLIGGLAGVFLLKRIIDIKQVPDEAAALAAHICFPACLVGIALMLICKSRKMPATHPKGGKALPIYSHHEHITIRDPRPSFLDEVGSGVVKAVVLIIAIGGGCLWLSNQKPDPHPQKPEHMYAKYGCFAATYRSSIDKVRAAKLDHDYVALERMKEAGEVVEIPANEEVLDGGESGFNDGVTGVRSIRRKGDPAVLYASVDDLEISR
jgi:hypothetical protein